MRKIIANFPPKQTVVAMALPSYVMAFLVMFFSPFDTYLHNPTGFMVGWKFLLPIFLLFTIGAFAVIFYVLLAIWFRNIWSGIVLLLFCGAFVTYLRFVRQNFLAIYPILMCAIGVSCIFWVVFLKILKEKMFFDSSVLLLFGMTSAMYAQLLFFNGEMVCLTGDQADYGNRTMAHIGNLVIWIGIGVFPFIVWNFLKMKRGKCDYSKVIIIVSFIYIGMQSAGLVASAIVEELPKGFEEDARYLAFEHLTKLSAEENIVVFLLDRLDADYVTETLETYPELNQKLDGFTFYKNNVSEYGGTFPSVCTMLTGYYYEYGQTFSDYWTQAWADDTYVGRLKGVGYTTNLSLDVLSTYHNSSEIEEVADNLIEADISVNYGGAMKITSGISMARMLPYLFKDVFLNRINMSLVGQSYFELFKQNGDRCENVDISSKGDLAFYDYLSDSPITADASSKTFNFIHLNCSHVDANKAIRTFGYHYNDETGSIEDEGNFIETTHACFEILNTYFEQMKASGVYDNTTIILVGDHGARLNPDADAYRGMTTGLLIKPQGVRGELKTDVVSELSNAYFGNSLLDIAEVNYDGISYFDVIGEGVVSSPRKYYSTSSWWGARNGTETISLLKVYEITGDANDWSNWKLITDFSDQKQK